MYGKLLCVKRADDKLPLNITFCHLIYLAKKYTAASELTKKGLNFIIREGPCIYYIFNQFSSGIINFSFMDN